MVGIVIPMPRLSAASRMVVPGGTDMEWPLMVTVAPRTAGAGSAADDDAADEVDVKNLAGRLLVCCRS